MAVVGERMGRPQDDQKLVKKIKNYIYDPTEQIGSGFSSKVFKGVNQLTGETIAVKVLELAKIQSEVEKYLLNNEINALRALSHPHVLRTIEILMTKNNVYIMTEFCDRGDLQAQIQKTGPLSELDALRLMRDVVDGYLAVEEKQIVHRDLKTANIFLTPTGARIADLGFCEFLNETKKPQLFYNVGSPAYMSPESYRDNVYSAKSDLWSMGIILYESLVGETPDKNLTYTEMSNNLMMGRIANIPNESIRRILANCFKKDLAERSSPRVMLESIEAELARMEAGKVRAPQSIIKTAPVISHHPLSPSNVEARPNVHQNRHMVNSMMPSSQNEIKPISPFKARFKGKEESGRQPSPLKVVERRFKEDIIQSRRVKALTQMLLLLFRALKAIGDVNIEANSYMRMVLFRHRSHLQGLAERVAFQEKLERSTNQPLKEFHFLKSRFDENYLQRQAQNSNPAIPPTVVSRLNQLSNTSFTDQKAVGVYSGLTMQAAKQCIPLLPDDPSKVLEPCKPAVALDYLLLHYESLQLYGEGLSVQAMAQAPLNLPSVLKEQPQPTTPAHIALLKIKQSQLQYPQREPIAPGPDSRVGGADRRTLLDNGFF